MRKRKGSCSANLQAGDTAQDKRDIASPKTDMRGLKQTEEQLKLLLKVVESAANSLLITDASGVIQWVNPAFCEITGYKSEEVIGRTPSFLKSGKQDKSFYDNLWETIKSGRVWHGEIINRRKDGVLYTEDMTITPVRDDAGEISHYIAVKQDISERKRVEKIKDEFISIVSHELRTPLTSIRGSLALMTGGVAGELPPQAKRFAEIALRNSERLIRLVNDMLDVEKINAGKMIFTMRPYEIRPLVEHALEVNRGYGEQYEVDFVIEDRLNGKASVQVDSDRFEQVMANLLSNAAKFSPPHETIVVAISRYNGCVRVSVADRGQGIPAEFHDKIFDAFVQVDSSDTRGKGGSGLGLTITRTIVERLGGEISFESTPGEGAIFHVDLPEWRKSSFEGREGDDFGRHRILICEDDRDVAAFINRVLRKGGFDTDISYNAAQAKQLMFEQRYDALVLDLLMPYQDGISLIREIKEDERFHCLPVIVVSAKAKEGREMLGGSVLGVVDWIEKPIDYNRLLDSVKLATHGAVKGKAHILHVEDDTGIIDLAADILKEMAVISVATTVREAVKRLQEGEFDLVILDLVLSDGSGLELLPLLRAGSEKEVPVVIFTGYEIAEETMKDVAAVLYKGQTSAHELAKTVRSLIKSGCAIEDGK